MIRKVEDHFVKCRKCGQKGLWRQDGFISVLFTKSMLAPAYECIRCFKGLKPYHPDKKTKRTNRKQSKLKKIKHKCGW